MQRPIKKRVRVIAPKNETTSRLSSGEASPQVTEDFIKSLEGQFHGTTGHYFPEESETGYGKAVLSAEPVFVRKPYNGDIESETGATQVSGDPAEDQSRATESVKHAMSLRKILTSDWVQFAAVVATIVGASFTVFAFAFNAQFDAMHREINASDVKNQSQYQEILTEIRASNAVTNNRLDSMNQRISDQKDYTDARTGH